MTSAARRPVPALLALLLLSACQPSRVSSSATVNLSGTLQTQAGAPVAARQVVLAPQTHAGEAIGGSLLTLLSLGTLCLADPPPEPCASFLRDSRSIDTGADGRFSFTLKGSEVRTFFGNAQVMGISADLPPGPGTLEGPAVLTTFRVQTEQLDLGPVRFWEPQFNPGNGRAEWEAAPGQLGGGSRYQLDFTTDQGGPIWRVESTSAGAGYDPRVLEDGAGRVSVAALRNGVAMGTTTDTIYRSAQLPFRGTAGKPLSRGRPCTLQQGNASPVPLPACGATDGRLEVEAGIPSPEQPSPGSTASPPPAVDHWVVVDLGRPVDVSLLVTRGCDCRAQASAEGSSWADLGDVKADDVIEPRRVRARYVRVGGPGEDFSGLREISVW
jgi:hypothetical protein